MTEITQNYLSRMHRENENIRQAEYLKKREDVIQRRVDRLARCAMQYDLEELANRYAWQRLLVMELEHALQKASSLLEKERVISSSHETRTAVYFNCARVFSEKVRQNRIDRRKGGVIRAEKSPKTKAMAAVKVEFDRWQNGEVQYTNNPDFAKSMMQIHGATIVNEGSIKNKCIEWHRKRKKSSS